MFEWQFHVKALKNLSKKHHSEIPGLWMQVLDAGFWTLDDGLETLNTRVWTCRLFTAKSQFLILFDKIIEHSLGANL